MTLRIVPLSLSPQLTNLPLLSKVPQTVVDVIQRLGPGGDEEFLELVGVVVGAVHRGPQHLVDRVDQRLTNVRHLQGRIRDEEGREDLVGEPAQLFHREVAHLIGIRD